MNRAEKASKKAYISEYIDLANGHYTEEDIDFLESLVDRRDLLNGKRKSYHCSGKWFDSDGTSRYEQIDTYTFISDNFGIRIDHDVVCDWDDGKQNTQHESYTTARELMKYFKRLC